MFNRRTVFALTFSVSFFTATAAPAAPAVAKKAPAKPGAAKKPATKPEDKLDQYPLIARLTPLLSGPGVLVCEPVAPAGSSLAELGAGCGRWLNLVVGGQGEFGKTPLWTSVRAAVEGMGKGSPRLVAAEASGLAQVLPLTHVATGEISEQGGAVTLTYRLLAMPAKTPVGEAVRVSGTEVEVVAGLPKLARGLAIAAGAHSPAVPDALAETPAELRFLGSLPWVPDGNLSSENQEKLRSLAAVLLHPPAGTTGPRPTLAPFLAAFHYEPTFSDDAINQIGEQLAKALPDNAQVQAQLAVLARQAGARSDALTHAKRTDEVTVGGMKVRLAHTTGTLPVEALPALQQRFPNNNLLWVADNSYQRIAGRLDLARKAAETAVRCAPRNPFQWLMLGGTLYEQSEATRQGKPFRALSPAEVKTIEPLYEDWVPVCLKAVRLNPKCVEAWCDLATAATFVGAEELADGACGQAVHLAPRNYRVISWGLEMYQPKWLDGAGKLKLIAELAVKAAPEWAPFRRQLIAGQLREAGFAELAEKVSSTKP